VKPAEDFVVLCDIVKVKDDTSKEGARKKIDLNLGIVAEPVHDFGMLVLSHYRCLRTTWVTYSKR